MGWQILNPIIIFLVLFAASILPVTWMLRVWSEQLVSTRLAILGMIMHILSLIILFSISPILLMIYCGIALLAIGFSVFLDAQAEWFYSRRKARADIERYTKMLEAHPDNAAIHAALGRAYWESNLYDEAVVELETAIRMDPHNSRTEEILLQKVRDRQQLITEKRNT